MSNSEKVLPHSASTCAYLESSGSLLVFVQTVIPGSQFPVVIAEFHSWGKRMPYTYPFRYVDQDLKLNVWGKAQPIIGQDSFLWRSDICGAIMRFTDHGDTNSKYGWEIDHIKPTSLDGTDELSNLQPLHWENNRKKGDSYPWYCQ